MRYPRETVGIALIIALLTDRRFNRKTIRVIYTSWFTRRIILYEGTFLRRYFFFEESMSFM